MKNIFDVNHGVQSNCANSKHKVIPPISSRPPATPNMEEKLNRSNVMMEFSAVTRPLCQPHWKANGGFLTWSTISLSWIPVSSVTFIRPVQGLHLLLKLR